MSATQKHIIDLLSKKEYKFICEVIADVRMILLEDDINPYRKELMDLSDYLQFFANKMEDAIISKNALLLRGGFKKCPTCKSWMKPEFDELGRFCTSCGMKL